MNEAQTARIWEISENEDIAWRQGAVALDVDEVITSESDVTAILTVARGLQPRDFAVFLEFPQISPVTDEGTAEGYLIGQVDESDGSGVIVHSTLVARDPTAYASGRIEYALKYLNDLDPNFLEDFSLQSLKSYLRK